MWILQSATPDDDAFTFRLPPGAIKTVGRAPRADFVVDAALVSRLHCRLTAGDSTVEVVDLSSTNGTLELAATLLPVKLQLGFYAFQKSQTIRERRF